MKPWRQTLAENPDIAALMDEDATFTLRLTEEELTLRLTEAASDFLVGHGYDEHFGARPLKRAIQRFIEDPLSEKILVGDFSKGDEIEVDVSADKSKLDFRVLTSSTKA